MINWRQSSYICSHVQWTQKPKVRLVITLFNNLRDLARLFSSGMDGLKETNQLKFYFELVSS